MTAAHCEPIKLRLQIEGFNVERYERSGQLTCVTTDHLLGTFMAGGILDEEIFRSTIGDLIDHTRAAVRNGHRGKVRIFGEMVSQLRTTDLTVTTRMEELWNEVIDKHSVSLLCTYALHDEQDQVPELLTALHSANIEREKSTMS
jgi:hypothetical protein